ncbi:hypothetical protein BC833DRAFT_658161 [Globomyces pollinis-pini]|nr:hypothetical protein BC833DRAFT_658161 [Globomyces pollinis-pini]
MDLIGGNHLLVLIILKMLKIGRTEMDGVLCSGIFRNIEQTKNRICRHIQFGTYVMTRSSQSGNIKPTTQGLPIGNVIAFLFATASAMPVEESTTCTPVILSSQTTGLGASAVEVINSTILPALKKDLNTYGIAGILSYQSITKNAIQRDALVGTVEKTVQDGSVFVSVSCQEDADAFMEINTAIF